MELYFTRHGKTEWNQEKRFQGMTGDSPLLPTSYAEIKRLGQIVQEIPFSKMYSSTSLRAIETAETLNQMLVQPVEIVYTDALKELGLGKLEGQRIDQMTSLYQTELNNMRYYLDQYNPTAFAGEPIMSAIQRITRVIKEAVGRETGPLFFVGHGASLTASIQYLTGKKLSELRQMGGLKNNSLSILETDGQVNEHFQLKVWNDHSFLK